jgi:bifunctional N-acetylglucosamine-1-phosphate-uridyltransferase/glucosamine-1-phosphate-acetyltransferase GlmU-like protein
MSKTLLLIPAAGTGSRLGANVPKPLVRAGQQRIVDYVRAAWPDADLALVINPLFDALWRQSVAAHYYLHQEKPLGMGDAILRSIHLWPQYENIVVAWGDTVWLTASLAEHLNQSFENQTPKSFLVPALETRDGYISMILNSRGSVESVLERREGDGDQMQGPCLSDLGVFLFSAHLHKEFSDYMNDARWGVGKQTKEKNFLAFMSYLTAQGHFVEPHRVTIDSPVVGINTPEELDLFENYLKGTLQ